MVLVEEALYFVGERALVGSQFKVHGNAPEGARAGTDEWCTYAGHHGNLTDSQVNVAPAQDQIQRRRIDLGRKIEMAPRNPAFRREDNSGRGKSAR
ncbi:hypothetical protein GCM10023205_56590 [Yinghuangia aomiensis]|uniref:Uncharacterized protein n=1 Tax=Yinghuangia aomiensis TaxID=676205 RepID=A0ABP9HW62_9ACTN